MSLINRCRALTRIVSEAIDIVNSSTICNHFNDNCSRIAYFRYNTREKH